MRPLVRPLLLVPAFNAEATVGDVVRDLARVLPGVPVLVVDDGSMDTTARRAREAGATWVITHPTNRGKGAALQTGLGEAEQRGFDAVVTVDADGQHPAESARVLVDVSCGRSLVLGVRDLERDGAPRANRFSNGFSNRALGLFSGKRLADTQCGLRRYPTAEALALGARASGFAFEAEVLLRAIAAGVPIVEVPVRVVYPTGRRSHFHVVRDPARIVAVVLLTVWELRGFRRRDSNPDKRIQSPLSYR